MSLRVYSCSEPMIASLKLHWADRSGYEGCPQAPALFETTHCLALDTLCLAAPLHLADLKKYERMFRRTVPNRSYFFR